MTKILEVIQFLKDHGFIADGQTMIEHVRIATIKNPVVGAGVPATFGGRLRFKHNDVYCTVGKQTTHFYEKDPYVALKSFKTREQLSILKYLDSNFQPKTKVF